MHSPVLTVTLNPAIDLHLEIEDWRPAEVARARRAVRAAGGKGVNVARVLAALGIPATAAVALGLPDGAVYRDLLKNAPFDIAALPAPGPVRTNVTIAAPGTPRRIKINQPGPAWSRAAWRAALDRLISLMRNRRWIALSGALPPGVPVNAYAQLIRAAHRAGACCAIDGSGPALRRALAARPDLVRINREELAEVLEMPLKSLRSRAATLDAARRLIGMGAAMAAVTDGPKRALFITGDATWTVRPPRIEAQGALGAGDAMLAGLLAGFMKNDAPAEAFKLALACGAASASLPETQFPTRRQILSLLR